MVRRGGTRRQVPWAAALVASALVLTSARGAETVAETEPRAAPAPTLHGTVLLPDGRPAAGATVLAAAVENGRRTGRPVLVETREDGGFAVLGLPGASFRVLVVAAGAAPLVVDDATGGEALRLRLLPGRKLGGRVLDRGSGSPVAGATVRACDEPMRWFSGGCRRRETGEDGRFAFDDLSEGEHRIDALASGHTHHWRSGVAVPAALDAESGLPEELTVFLGPGGTIAGHVVDPAGKRVPGVSVRLESLEPVLRAVAPSAGWDGPEPSRTTDAEGTFEVRGVPADTPYRLVLHRRGSPTVDRHPVRVEKGRTVRLEMTLPSGAVLTLRVVDADERPVREVELLLEGQGLDPPVPIDPEKIEVDEKGGLVARPLIEGEYRLLLTPAGHRTIERRIVLHDGETTDLGTLVARPGRTLLGSVRATEGDPVAEAVVRAAWKRGEDRRQRTTETGEDGRFRLDGLDDDGLDLLTVRADGFVPERRDHVTLDESPVEIVLERAGTIAGSVIAPDGSRPSGVRIEAHREAGAAARPPAGLDPFGKPGAGTDEDGRFRLENVEPGTHTVEARAAGWAPGRKSGVEVAPGQEVDVGPIELHAGSRVVGRVVRGVEEAPVPDAVVTATRPAARFELVARPLGVARTFLDGRFEIAGLEPGPITLRAEHPEHAPREVSHTVPEEDDGREVSIVLDGGGNLVGRVTDGDGLPVSGAQVVVRQGLTGTSGLRSIATDLDGRYRFDRLAAGAYVVGLTRDTASLPEIRQATIEEGGTTVVDFGEQGRIRLGGRVLRGERPFGDASLSFVALGAAVAARAATADGDGRYEVLLEDPGTYLVLVAPGGTDLSLWAVASRTVSLVVPDEPEVTRDLVLGEMAIRGTVTGPGGEPVRDAMVVAQGPGASPVVAVTDEHGAYLLADLDPATYGVSVRASGYVDATTSVIVADGTVDADFGLEEGRSLRGRVVDPTGRGIGGAWVHATGAAAGETTLTDANGAFALVSPNVGTTVLTAGARGWATARVTVAVVGEEREVETSIRLTAGGRITITVLDRDGAPAPDVVVAAIAVGDTPSSPSPLAETLTPTDAEGRVRFVSLAPGTYRVTTLSALSNPNAPSVIVHVREGEESTATLRP